MQQVELHPAYLWICDACGKENVLVAEKLDSEIAQAISNAIFGSEQEEFDEEQEEPVNYLEGEIDAQFLDSDDEESDSILEVTLGEGDEEDTMYFQEYEGIFRCPSTVVCKYCKAEFETHPV